MGLLGNNISIMDIVVYLDEKQCNQLLPTPLRCLIVGSSGSGKTNLLLNIIYNKNGLSFKYLYLFSRSIEQAAYVQLRKLYSTIEDRIGEQIAQFFSSCSDLITVDECKNNSLVVFDDCLLEEQLKIKDYFIRGRHKQISCIYLSQSYGRVDMQMIRNNVNMLCIFSQNKHYTKKIYNDFVGSDMIYSKFEELCKHCWDTPYGFLTINTTRKVHEGKYRCMFKYTLK